MKSFRKEKGRAWALIVLVSLGLHYLMLVVASVMLNGGFSPEAVGRLLVSRWTEPGDATRYLDLAANGYVAEGENAINLVFYPLYPLLVRWLGALTGLTAAGLIVSQASYAAASVLLYELILIDGDERSAWDGVLLLALYPFSMFVMGIFTEGLFLLLTLGCLYALRKRRFAPAGCVGFLAALTRAQGMLLIFPAVYELVSLRWGREKRRLRWSDLCVILIPAGFGVYLWVNYALHGNFTQFLVYEADEPWYQTTQWIGRNIAQQYGMALEYPGLDWVIYWPQIALYFFVLGVLFYGLKQKERMSLVLYGGVYMGFTYLSGWMISGGRYLLCCVPLFVILAKAKSDRARRFLLLIFSLLFFAYSYFYLAGFAIM